MSLPTQADLRKAKPIKPSGTRGCLPRRYTLHGPLLPLRPLPLPVSPYMQLQSVFICEIPPAGYTLVVVETEVNGLYVSFERVGSGVAEAAALHAA